MNIRMFICILFFSIAGVNCFAQSLKEIILNKEGKITSNWVNEIQKVGEWHYVNTFAVKRKRVNEFYLGQLGKEWTFESNQVHITPFHFGYDEDRYSDFDVQYFQNSNMIVIGTMVTLAGIESYRKMVYEVINVTPDYLVLEEIKYTYCFDFEKGRRLTKEECIMKQKNTPKRLFGGVEISVGKPPKQRLVFSKNQPN